MVITAICMGNQCFISASVCLFLIKTPIPIPSVVCLFGITYWCRSHKRRYKDTHFAQSSCQKNGSLAPWMFSCVSNHKHLAQSCKICPRWQKQVVHNLILPPATNAVSPLWGCECIYVCVRFSVRIYLLVFRLNIWIRQNDSIEVLWIEGFERLHMKNEWIK